MLIRRWVRRRRGLVQNCLSSRPWWMVRDWCGEQPAHNAANASKTARARPGKKREKSLKHFYYATLKIECTENPCASRGGWRRGVERTRPAMTAEKAINVNSRSAHTMPRRMADDGGAWVGLGSIIHSCHVRADRGSRPSMTKNGSAMVFLVCSFIFAIVRVRPASNCTSHAHTGTPAAPGMSCAVGENCRRWCSQCAFPSALDARPQRTQSF